MSQTSPDCELCRQPGGAVLWESSCCRVVGVSDPDYPGFCRVIWKSHVREMTDLDAASRVELMRVVLGVESVVRNLFRPHKINLASFGNRAPHLHWHVIPRWEDDRHFPEPVWGAVQRPQSHTARQNITSTELAEALKLELETQTPCAG